MKWKRYFNMKICNVCRMTWPWPERLIQYLHIQIKESTEHQVFFTSKKQRICYVLAIKTFSRNERSHSTVSITLPFVISHFVLSEAPCRNVPFYQTGNSACCRMNDTLPPRTFYILCSQLLSLLASISQVQLCFNLLMKFTNFS
jgi:hypothetical protein